MWHWVTCASRLTRGIISTHIVSEGQALPERTDVGIVCWRRSTNLNILSPSGRKPSLSANVTMPSPTGGTNNNRPNIIAAIVFRPSLELPGPGPITNQPKRREDINIVSFKGINVPLKQKP